MQIAYLGQVHESASADSQPLTVLLGLGDGGGKGKGLATSQILKGAALGS